MTMIAVQTDERATTDVRADGDPASTGARRRLAWMPRALLIAGTAAAVVAASRVGDPAALLGADPDLARLLHGMAAIKTLLVASAIAIVAWRFGHPLAPRTAAGYVVGVVAMAGATTLIWRLSAIVPAAVLFHAGALLSLIVAWRDDCAFVRLRARDRRRAARTTA